MRDNKNKEKSAKISQDQAKTSVSGALSPLGLGFLLIIFVIGLPLIWFANDAEFRCQLCRDTKGQICIGVFSPDCLLTHIAPVGMEPENL